MTAKLFEAALGIAAPWSVQSVEFDESAKVLTVLIDFKPGSRFAVAGHQGAHPVHDTVTKSYRHLNFFQHECHLEVRVPRVRLPDGLADGVLVERRQPFARFAFRPADRMSEGARTVNTASVSSDHACFSPSCARAISCAM